MKVGFIRCTQTEGYCPGTTCLNFPGQHKGVFAEFPDEDIQIVGFTKCGGCPGKRTVEIARLLISKAADTIAFSSCIRLGTPIGYPCPFARKMIETVRKNVGEDVRILDYTHDGPDGH